MDSESLEGLYLIESKDKEVEEFALMRADGLIKALNASEGQRNTKGES